MTNFRQVLDRFIDTEVIVHFNARGGTATSRGMLREFGEDYLILEVPASNVCIPYYAIMKVMTPIAGSRPRSTSPALPD